MSLNNIIQEDRRYHILRFLADEQDYSMSQMVLCRALKMIGHGTDPDVVATDLSWLKTQGLITLSSVSKFTIATITRRGVAVAAGDVTIPGIARVVPEA